MNSLLNPLLLAMLPVEPFLDFVTKNALFDHQKRVLAAVSGGKDSVLLAHLLKSCGFEFAMAHCNFQLRGSESLRDEQFTAKLALQLGVPFFLTQFNTIDYADKNSISVQMAARKLRYNWFEKIAAEENFDVIALAHHQNDAIETVLLNLTRGTGIAGMHGILPKSGKLVRPMLFLSAENIKAIVAAENIDFVEDSSNSSAKYARNKIRLEVVPKLKELNPQLEKTFEKNLERFRELEQLLDNQLQTLRDTVFINQKFETRIKITNLKNLHPKQLLLFGLLREFNFSETVVQDIIASLEKHPGKIFQSATHRLILDRTEVIIYPKKERREESGEREVKIEKDHTEIQFQDFKLNILQEQSAVIIKNNRMIASVSAEKIIFPLSMRNWRPGDYFFPLGMQNRQKLSDFFIHQKINVHQKSRTLILINSNGEIIWIAGLRLDDRYKVQPHTKKTIIFELCNL